MSYQLTHLLSFCHTYEQGSFSSAAKQLGVSPQAVSRAVGRLEASLGVVLFRRNTRQVEPTTAADTYYDAVRHALDVLQSAQLQLSQSMTHCAGTVRISVPTTYGHHRFMLMLGDFLDAYPDVMVDVQVSNHNIDFVKQGFDLAIRMGTLDDASFVARRLGEFSLGVFASPDYLARYGTPMDVASLDAHRCGVFVMPRTGRLLPWSLAAPEEVFLPEANAQVRDDFLGLITFALGGGGLVQVYHFLVEDALRRGDLVEVLTERAGRRRPFSLIYPKSVASRPEVRALIDFVLERTKCVGDA